MSLEPPPWLVFTTSSPSGSATRVSPPGSTQTCVAVVDRERAAGRRGAGAARRRPASAPCDSCTTGWAIQPRGSASSRARSCVQLGPGRLRADHDALAAGAVDRLDHQLVEPVEHLVEVVGLLEPPGVDVGQDRLLAEVVADRSGT